MRALNFIGHVMLGMVMVEFVICTALLLLGMIVGGGAVMFGLLPDGFWVPISPELGRVLAGWLMLTMGLLVGGMLLIAVAGDWDD